AMAGEASVRHRLDGPVDDEARTEPGAEAEKQHTAAAITAGRLHRGVVDHPHRPAEGALEVETDPAATQVVRLGGDLAAQHQARIADRYRCIFPARGALAHLLDRKSTRLNSSHSQISYAVFCLKKKKK